MVSWRGFEERLGACLFRFVIVVIVLFVPQSSSAAITYLAGSSLDTTGSAQGLSTPVYSSDNTVGSLIVLIMGMKPANGQANKGEVTTPPGWTRIASTTGGGYGTTLGADTGNTHMFAFYRVADGTEHDNELSITLANDNITWANLFRLTNDSGGWDVAATTGEDTTGDASVSIAMNSDPDVQGGDYILGGMTIPTDVQTPTQFSAHALTQSGVTFGTVTEVGEVDSTTGTDIGGFLYRAPVSSGTSSGAPTLSATAAGTVTNVRGPGVFVRIRETAAPTAPALHPDDGGSNQIAHNNARQNDTTPIFRASATHGSTFDRFQIELNTAASFTGTSYTEAFSGTYSSGTQYNLQTTGSLGLPTTDGATYYVRVRASSDAGAHYGAWSTGTWTYTYSSSGNAMWHQTTARQFETGTLRGVRRATTTTDTIELAGLPAVMNYTRGATENPATSLEMIKPRGVIPGDLLLIIVGNDDTTNTAQWSTTIDADGFTFMNDVGNTSSDAHVGVFYRIADGTEEISTTTSSQSSDDMWGFYVRVSGVDASTPIDVVGADTTIGAATSMAITDITTTVANTLAFYAAAYDGGDGNPFGVTGGNWAKRDGINSTGSTQADAAAAGGTWGTVDVPGTGSVGSPTVTSPISDGFAAFAWAVRPPASLTSGTSTSPVIDFDWRDGATAWDEAIWSETETNGTVSVRVLGSNATDCDTEIISLTTTSPIDLSSLTSTGDGQLHNRICLEAVLTYSGGTPLLNDWSVTWDAGSASPVVTTGFASNVGATSATLHGTINEGTDITEHGFAYATDSTLSSGVSTSTLGAGAVGTFNDTIDSLLSDTTYYFRAYAINAGGTVLGSIHSFFTGNTSVSRTMRLFEGFRINLHEGTIKLYQSP